MLSFEDQYERIFKKLSIKILDDFSALKSNEDRIKFVIEFTSVVDEIVLPSTEQIPVKSNAKALEIRNKGNEFFRRDNHRQALLEYTKSCCYTVDNHFGGLKNNNDENICDGGLSLPIANRSAVLYHMKKYEESLNDINLALNKGYPMHLKYKLFERKGDCFKMLAKINEASDAYECSVDHLKLSKMDGTKIDKHLKLLLKKKDDLLLLNSNINNHNTDKHSTEDRIKSMIKFPKPIPVLKGRSNITFPSLSESCNVVYDESRGRYIRATRDIEPGEIVMIEKPYASILVPEQYLLRCNVCLKPTFNAIPCSNCVYVVFCSEECREESLKGFHRFECSILCYFSLLVLDKFDLLILRTILSVPAQNVMKYGKGDMSAHYDADRKVVLDDENKYSWNDYSAICDLASNENKKIGKDLFHSSIEAQFLLKLLEKTDYFKDINDIDNLTGIKIQTAKLMLDHYLAFTCNAHEISEIRLDPSSVYNSLPAKVGAGIYSTLSLFSHSCDPVVAIDFYGNYCVARAIGFIKKGSEVSSNYGPLFQTESKKQRQECLAQKYSFLCACDACRYNWPLFSETLEEPPVFLCDVCHHPLIKNSRQTVTIITCQQCNTPQNFVAKVFLLNNYISKFEKSFDLLLNFKPEEALPGIIEYLTKLSKTVHKPWSGISRGQESLKQCCGMMGNCTMI